MKKFSKVVLCLAATAMLGGCAKTVTPEEAIKSIATMKIEDVKATSGEMTTKVEKLSGEGTYGKQIVALFATIGLVEGAEKKTEIKDLSEYFITTEEIDAAVALMGDKLVIKQDGTAFSFSGSYEQSVTAEDSDFDIAYSVAVSQEISYRADGLPSSSFSKQKMTFGDADTLELNLSASFSWIE